MREHVAVVAHDRFGRGKLGKRGHRGVDSLGFQDGSERQLITRGLVGGRSATAVRASRSYVERGSPHRRGRRGHGRCRGRRDGGRSRGACSEKYRKSRLKTMEECSIHL